MKKLLDSMIAQALHNGDFVGANASVYQNYECIYENGQYNAYYHRNKQYISIQECEEDANHYSYSNHICQLSGDYTSLDVCSSSSKGKPRCEMSAK